MLCTYKGNIAGDRSSGQTIHTVLRRLSWENETANVLRTLLHSSSFCVVKKLLCAPQNCGGGRNAAAGMDQYHYHCTGRYIVHIPPAHQIGVSGLPG